jgi:hypothetical protein
MSEKLKVPERNIEYLKRYVYPKLSGINIVRGCGTRTCRICSEDSPVYKNSMDFETLKMLFSTYEGDRQLMLFGQGDPIYYENGIYSIRDVFALAREFRVRVDARTHGCLRSETKTVNAVQALVAYLSESNFDRSQTSLDLSVDEYGWYGVSPEEHTASFVAFYSLIAALNPVVYAFSNRNAAVGEIGNRRRIYEMLEVAGVPQRRIADQEIYYFNEDDRPSKLIPKPPMDKSFTPWMGTYIDYDGTILYNHPTLNVIRCGNIFGTIFTNSLPNPERGY